MNKENYRIRYHLFVVIDKFGILPAKMSLSTASITDRLAESSRTDSFLRAEGKNSSGLPFVTLVKQHGTYGMVFETSAQYDVRLLHGTTSNLHWITLLKMKDSKLPYITIN